MDCINQMMSGMMGGGAMGWLMMGSVLLSVVLIVVGLALLIAWLARRLGIQGQGSGPANDTANTISPKTMGTGGLGGSPGNGSIPTSQEAPLTIAQRRYASGEIGP